METNEKEGIAETPETIASRSSPEIHHYYHKEDNAPKKWCWTKFVTGFLKHKLIAFIVTTAMVIWIISWLMVLHGSGKPISQSLMIFFYIVGGVWGISIIVFMLSGAIDNAVYNAQLKMEIKAGAQVNFDANTAEVIKAANKSGGRE